MRSRSLAVAAFVLFAAHAAANAADASSPSPQDLVHAATAIAGSIKSDPVYAKELRVAHGIVLIPDVHAPGSPHALLLKHDSDGLWSPPAFITVGPLVAAGSSPSRSGPAAILLMTSRALDDLSRSRFTIGEGADLDVVTYVPRHGGPLGEGDIELWSPAGALDGVSLTGATVAQETGLNQSFYGHAVTVADILAGHVAKNDAASLRRALPL